MAQRIASAVYKVENSFFRKKCYFYTSFWITLIMFGFWCECHTPFPSELGHFESCAFFLRERLLLHCRSYFHTGDGGEGAPVEKLPTFKMT